MSEAQIQLLTKELEKIRRTHDYWFCQAKEARAVVADLVHYFLGDLVTE